MFVAQAKTKLHTVSVDRKWFPDFYFLIFGVFLWHMRH